MAYSAPRAHPLRVALPAAWPGALILLGAFLLAIVTHRHYGVAWDEPFQIETGRVSYNYVFNGDTALFQHPERHYGAGFSLCLAMAEKALGLTDTHPIYRMRHLLTHTFFLAGVFCGYLLALRLARRQWLALAALLMLLLHPRIYAHSFFNPKDIPFLSVVTACLLLGHLAFEKEKSSTFLAFGLLCGWAASIRIIGVLIPCCAGLILLARLAASTDRQARIRLLKGAGWTVVGTVAALYLCWPYLWTDPVGRFAESWRTMSHFPWGGMLLFQGEVVQGDAMPRSYIPIWFGISTPLVWMLAGLAGICLTLWSVIRKPRLQLASADRRSEMLHLLCAAVPVAMVVLLHSVVYDDWRHLYFIWPPLVMLALRALQWAEQTRARIPVRILFALQSATVIVFMVRHHPFQQVYFNSLAPQGKEKFRSQYELDYWGVAYKQGLEYILAHDTARQIKVYWSLHPLVGNREALPPESRTRILLHDTLETSDYFITNFRHHPEDYPYPDIFYQEQVCDNTILRVYRLRPPLRME